MIRNTGRDPEFTSELGKYWLRPVEQREAGETGECQRDVGPSIFRCTRMQSRQPLCLGLVVSIHDWFIL